MLKQWKLMEPIKVGNKIWRNRIVMAPMESRLSNPDGSSTVEMAEYYAERAKGGASAIIVENTFIDNKASRSSLVSSGLYSDHLIASKYIVAEGIKDNGAIAILQIGHGGRQAIAGATDLPCVAPSEIMCKVTQRLPHALSIEEIKIIEDDFTKAAQRAKQAGFDGVEIHGAHGYLVCSFLSPYTNKREDEYGGSLENRGAFPRNIIRKVREAVGDDFILGYRISGEEFVEGGQTIQDSVNFVKSVEDQIDYIHVSAGNYESMAEWLIMPMYVPQAPLTHLAREMKKDVGIPVITVGALSPELGEKALQNGDADLIAFGRQLLADPYTPNKIKENRLEDIRTCCRGNQGCISSFFTGCPMRCEVNPQAGREKAYAIKKTNNPKHVLIVGGGVAGLEAARVADLYGHRVTLAEKSGRLGGHFIEATIPDFKSEGAELLRWLILQVEKSDAEILLNKQMDPTWIKGHNPDAVIVAIGSQYASLPIDGAENTVNPDTVLFDISKAGGQAAVIGGGLLGAETALYLAENSIKVTILEMLPDIATDGEPLSQIAIKNRLDRAGVVIYTSCRVISVQKGSLTYQDAAGNEKSLFADTIVAAVGLNAKTEEADRFEGTADEVYRIGDCKAGRKIYDCFHEAWHAVRCISGVS